MPISSPAVEQMELSQLAPNSTGVGTLYARNASLNERRTTTESSASPSVDLPRTETLQTQATRVEKASALARRIHGWSWQAFPMGLGTGAVYLTMSNIKTPPTFFHKIETVFFFFNVVLFSINTLTLALQAILYPRKARRTVTDPVLGIYVPLIVLSFATIIIGTVNYGHVSHPALYALFWIYIASALIVSFGMLMTWFNKPHQLSDFTPTYAFLIFPLMLSGVVASSVMSVLDLKDSRSIGILLVGYFFQGLGLFLTFFYICIYIIRIMMTGFLRGHQANGAFIACGPPGFTALALIELGRDAQVILPTFNLVSQQAGDIWFATSVLFSIMLFGLAVFFFVFGALPYAFKVRIKLSEILSCWALTFPNVGWIVTIRLLGDIFNIRGFYILHIIMTIWMIVTWGILFVLTIFAFATGRILKSGHEEVIKDTAVFLARRKDHHRELEKVVLV
ncbi:hypothetical protein CPC08DRAFT_707120 [Agrocybe pediades]|nr:hypothetical protein CPC08DRAFT_707120 [Agrocybe pediades]